MAYRIFIDTGGTFTDGVCVNEKGDLVTAKSPTTPEDLTVGTMNVVDALAALCGLERTGLLSAATTLVNGTTAGTNAVLTKQGAKVGIICTKGFPDVIELRRVPKIDMFDWRMPFPKPLVPRRLRVEVEERINKRGETVPPLTKRASMKRSLISRNRAWRPSLSPFFFRSWTIPTKRELPRSSSRIFPGSPAPFPPPSCP